MTFEERAEFLFQSIQSHDRQLGEITSNMAELQESIKKLEDAVYKLVIVSNEDATNIRALARLAEHRMSGGSPILKSLTSGN